MRPRWLRAGAVDAAGQGTGPVRRRPGPSPTSPAGSPGWSAAPARIWPAVISSLPSSPARRWPGDPGRGDHGDPPRPPGLRAAAVPHACPPPAGQPGPRYPGAAVAVQTAAPGRRGPADGAVYRECERLEELGLDEDPVRTPPWYPGDAADVLAASLATGLEGVVGKPLASTYHPGQCRDWIKVKNVRHQEVIRGRWRRWRRRRRAAVTWTRPGSWPGGPRQRPGRSPTRSGRCRLAEVAGAPAGRGLGRPGLGARPGGQRR